MKSIEQVDAIFLEALDIIREVSTQKMKIILEMHRNATLIIVILILNSSNVLEDGTSLDRSLFNYTIAR